MRTDVRRGTEGPGSSLGSPALGGAFVMTVLLLIGVVAVASRAPIGASGVGRASIARAVGRPARSVLRCDQLVSRPNPHGAELRTLGSKAGEPRSEMCPSPAPAAAPGGSGWSFQLPTWVLPLVLSALAGGLVLLLFTLRARRGPVVSVDGDLEEVDAVRVAVDAVGAAVDASLRDLRDGQDPRRAVIAAYRRMEQTLTAAGLPRRPAETAREYVVHALTSLELCAEPPRTLTTLFERARFSVRPIDVAMRDQAIDALVAMQQELKGIG